MTKKDYIKIAERLKNNRPKKESRCDGLWFEIVEDMVEVLAEDNPRFDKRKFYTASGYYEE